MADRQPIDVESRLIAQEGTLEQLVEDRAERSEQLNDAIQVADQPEQVSSGQWVAMEAEPSSPMDAVGELPLPGQIALGAALTIGVAGCSIPVVRTVRNQLNQDQGGQSQFDARFGQQLLSYRAKGLEELAWWDQPRWQGKSFGQHLVADLYKPPVPEDNVFVHDRALGQIEGLAKRAIAIDNEKLSSHEFIMYLKMRVKFIAPETEEPGYLQKSVALLRASLAARRYFEKIWQIEMQYLGFKQQEVYKFVADLLGHNTNGVDFRKQVQAKLDAVVPEVKSQDGKDALTSYGEALTSLSEYDYGLELLNLFKQFQLGNYVVLRKIDELLSKWKQLNLCDPRVLKPDILENYNLLEELAPIIQFPSERVSPDGFLPLMQLMVLEIKHHHSYDEFMQLTDILKQWSEPYETIKSAREGYYSSDYRVPKSFKNDIPGIAVFDKYASYLNA